MTATAAVLTVAAAIHRKAGYSMPLPWPDESAFVWPAIDFSRSWSLFSPHVNHDRVVMWMPPAYTIATGLVFSLVRPGLSAARWLSFGWLCASFVCLIWLLEAEDRNRPLWFVGLVGASLVLCDPFFVAAGNLARMDSMLLCFVLLAALFIKRGHAAKGLFLSGFLPLIQPATETS